MNRSTNDRERPYSAPWMLALGLGLTWVLSSGIAEAQLTGTGGTVGTGTLTASDFFIGVQKVQGVNLSDVDKARFLNRASCLCQRDVWLKAILNASSAAKAATIAGTDEVTMKLGVSCDQPALTNQCPTIGSLTFSEFRLSGMVVHTTVDVLAQPYGANTIVTATGTGGTGGAGGATGTGGIGGTGGDSGTGGGTGVVSGSCDVNDAFNQPVWIFVGAQTLSDIGTGQLSVVIDGTAPPATPTVTVTGANEALNVTWTAINMDNSVPDLLGYQIFCTRADQYQVFKSGTFDTSIDSCFIDPGAGSGTGGSSGGTYYTGPTDLDPNALADVNTHYACSDLLSASTTSHRVQILENGINYGIAVASVDRHGNAALALPTPPFTMPKPTLDFYHQYRVGDPQGQATGGCAVVGPSFDLPATTRGLASGVIALGMVLFRRLRRRRS